MGKEVADKLWLAPVAEWHARARDIPLYSSSPQLAFHQYNTRAAPVLSYMSQIYPVPPAVIQMVLANLHWLFSIPMHTFGPKWFST